MDYHVYEYVVWKKQIDGSYKRIKKDMADGENAIAAKKAASESEGCLESEITIKGKLPQVSEGIEGSFKGEGLILLFEQIQHIYRVIFPYAKFLYTLNPSGEEQQKRQSDLIIQEKKFFFKKPIFWIFFSMIIITSLFDRNLFLLNLLIILIYFFGIRKLYVKTGKKFLLVSIIERFSK